MRKPISFVPFSLKFHPLAKFGEKKQGLQSKNIPNHLLNC
jgi:hypothetical protein